jgi:hypothetical protein
MRPGVVLRLVIRTKVTFVGLKIPWPIRDYRKVLVKICRVYVRVQVCCQSKGVLSGARARRNSLIVASYYLVQCWKQHHHHPGESR